MKRRLFGYYLASMNRRFQDAKRMLTTGGTS